MAYFISKVNKDLSLDDNRKQLWFHRSKKKTLSGLFRIWRTKVLLINKHRYEFL